VNPLETHGVEGRSPAFGFPTSTRLQLQHAPPLAGLLANALRSPRLCARVSISSPNPERSGIMYNLNVQNIHLRTAQ